MINDSSSSDSDLKTLQRISKLFEKRGKAVERERPERGNRDAIKRSKNGIYRENKSEYSD